MEFLAPLIDWMKSWPVAVLLAALFLLWCGMKIKEKVSSFVTKEGLELILREFRDQVSQISKSMADSAKETREVLRLNDLKVKEDIGRAHFRIDDLNKGLSELQGEHKARTGAHCAVPLAEEGTGG